MLAALVVLNNYFHDVATALLFATAVIAWVLERRVAAEEPSALPALRAAYPALSRFAAFALVWILLGGVPRTVFFPRYEFIPAVEKGLVALLVVKHVVMFAAVAFGAVMWLRIRRRAMPEGGR